MRGLERRITDSLERFAPRWTYGRAVAWGVRCDARRYGLAGLDETMFSESGFGWILEQVPCVRDSAAGVFLRNEERRLVAGDGSYERNEL